MLLKVTIVEGMGIVTCQMPAFQLNEATGKKTIFISEMTPALKEIKDFGMATIEKATLKEYRDFVVKASVNADKRARKRREAQLRKLMKTDGREQITLGSGVLMEIDPGDENPGVIKKEAEDELNVLLDSKIPPVRDNAIPFVSGTGPQEEEYDVLNQSLLPLGE